MSLWNVFKMQVGMQVGTSRNLNERWATKLLRAFWSVVFLLKGFLIAFRWLPNECLGSRVIHEGQRRWISNWAQGESPTLAGVDFHQRSVPRAEITNVRSVAEFAHRFRSGFSFYMTNWHSIDVNNRVYRLSGSSG